MHTRSHASTAPSNAGLILSLVDALPNPSGPLARSARALAHRLAQGTCNTADLDETAALMTRLLDETDAGLAYDEDGLLDGEFDA